MRSLPHLDCFQVVPILCRAFLSDPRGDWSGFLQAGRLLAAPAPPSSLCWRMNVDGVRGVSRLEKSCGWLPANCWDRHTPPPPSPPREEGTIGPKQSADPKFEQLGKLGKKIPRLDFA